MVILFVALYALYKGSEIILESVKHLSKVLGIQSKYYGAVLMGMVSSLPILALSLYAGFFGQSAIIVPTVFGATITTLLLLGGTVAIVGGSIVLWEDFLKTTLPVFCISVAFFILVIYDGVIDRLESGLLLLTFGIFIGYIYSVITEGSSKTQPMAPVGFSVSSVVFLLLGAVALFVGAKFSLEMVRNLSGALSISLPLLSITVLALGATAPTFILVLQALRRKYITFALGIIFGSCIFTLLFVVGVMGLWIGNVPVTELVITQGIPMLIVSSIIMFVSSLSKNVMRPVGLMMILLFLYFLLKLGVFIG